MSFEVVALEGGPANLLVTVDDANATSNNNVTSTSASTLYIVEVDCTENPGEDVQVRLYDAASPTVGTTAAEVLIPGFRGEKFEVAFSEGIPFATAMSVAVVTDGGATGGATNPTGTVKLRVLCKDS